MPQEEGRRPSIPFLLLSHHSWRKLSHTFRIPLCGTTLYVCARCSGIVAGFFVGLLYVDLLIATFSNYPILIGILTLPAAIDWFFQVFKRRESNNLRRVVTGALHGQLYAAGLIAIVRGMSVTVYFVLVWVGYLIAMYIFFRHNSGFSDYVRREW